MDSSIHEYVVSQLEAKKGKWPEVAKAAGMSYGTLKKIATRVSVAPRIDNLEKLAAYFRSVRRAPSQHSTQSSP